MNRLLAGLLATFVASSPSYAATRGDEPHRSPIALALSNHGSRLVTANQTAGTVSLVDVGAGKVVAEIPTGEKPAGIALSRDGKRGVVTHWYGYDIAVLEIGEDSLKVVGRVEVGPEPRGVAMQADGKVAYVAVGASNEVVRIDLDALSVGPRLKVGREPRGIALSPDGKTLAVGSSRSGEVAIIATEPWKIEKTIDVDGDNLRQMSFAADGKSIYLANMKNRGFATTRGNIDLGWVLGQRLTRVFLEGGDQYTTLSLDPQGRAASDAHGVAASPDGVFIAVSSGGTHEILLFRTDLKRIPWRYESSRDQMPAELLKNDGRFRRVETGGRPTELAFSPDGTKLYAANYLGDAIDVISAESATVIKTISLGAPEELSQVRRGEILFHDAKRSFNQWYSCNTCHSDGHTNGLDFDTLNDGRQDLSTSHKRSRKKVPTLRGVTRTGPWTWHGWQDRLEDAMIESFTKSMQGTRPSASEVDDLIAYLGTLDFPKNPNRTSEGGLTEEAKRGELVFRSSKADCTRCHGGSELNDTKVHVVGLEERDDAYKGYNPPSLKGTYDKDPYLHDGRSKTLEEALTGPHNPDDVTGLGELDSAEMKDLIAYLKSL